MYNIERIIFVALINPLPCISSIYLFRQCSLRMLITADPDMSFSESWSEEALARVPQCSQRQHQCQHLISTTTAIWNIYQLLFV